MRRNIVCSLIACAVGACTAPSSEPGDKAQPETKVEVQASSLGLMVPPTPAMLAATLTDDSDALPDLALTGTCHAPYTCPQRYYEYPDTPWSAGTWCDDYCDGGLGCPPEEGDHGQVVFQSSRVMYDVDSHSCTEWRLTTVPICGCFY